MAWVPDGSRFGAGSASIPAKGERGSHETSAFLVFTRVPSSFLVVARSNSSYR